MANHVIGQTGKVVISDGIVWYKASKKRTVRYRYVKVKHGFRAEVIGPFHSALYGACSYGTSRKSAKAALERRLANDYRYFGCFLLSDTDSADITGLSPMELYHRSNNVERTILSETAARPITLEEAFSTAGM
jgi:hypothetical protein